ncbi:hypothetical protein HOLleu_13853 [Holothuria leucospilota]|uniref:Uncharacterized protein n=1 Tax=Holothuria leucospilota TaxID=206669 RepID=A0A9Q1HC12_HOLLE|nr:hypothetical protein HOLleu_13853 [Holothuria leucospilota]
MVLDKDKETVERKIWELFHKLGAGSKLFQVYKLDRKGNLIPAEPNHPQSLCPNGSSWQI